MSNIYFKNIVLHHFMSYDHTEFSLARNGYIFISGINNNDIDNAKSNGSGKSSLFSALCWCLTGETPNGNKKIENIYLSGETYVELEFESNNDSYILKRSKNPSNLTIVINGENKSGKGIRDGEKLLAEYLPDITSQLINSVIILGQGLPKRFTNNSPSGRKEILEKLSNSDFMIEDIKSRLDRRKMQLDTDRAYIDSSIIENETKIRLLDNNIKLNTEKLQSFNSVLLELDIEKLKLEKLKEEDEIKTYNSAIEELNLNLDTYTDLLNTLSDSYDIEYSKLALIPQKEIDDIVEELISYKALFKSKNDEIDKLESIVDICPTCGQKIPGVEKLDTSRLKSECDDLNITINVLNNRIDKSKEHNNKLIQDLSDSFKNKKEEYLENISVLKSDIVNYSDKITNKKLVLDNIDHDLIELEIKLDNFIKLKEELENSIKQDKLEIDNCSSIVAENKQYLTGIENRLDIIGKMNTLIKRDFRGYLLTNIIKFIFNKIKIYSLKVFGTDNFIFDLDGNNIIISYDGKEYESLSGGEKQKVDVIIQLAIRDMLCKYLNFSSNILVLDEITDSLDVIGSQNILNLISTELSDVESIYIISHHSDFDIPLDEEITVVKGNDKISRII